MTSQDTQLDLHQIDQSQHQENAPKHRTTRASQYSYPQNHRVYMHHAMQSPSPSSKPSPRPTHLTAIIGCDVGCLDGLFEGGGNEAREEKATERVDVENY